MNEVFVAFGAPTFFVVCAGGSGGTDDLAGNFFPPRYIFNCRLSILDFQLPLPDPKLQKPLCNIISSHTHFQCCSVFISNCQLSVLDFALYQRKSCERLRRFFPFWSLRVKPSRLCAGSESPTKAAGRPFNNQQIRPKCRGGSCIANGKMLF